MTDARALADRLLVRRGDPLTLDDINAHATPGLSDGKEDRDLAEAEHAFNVQRIADLQYLLWAESRRSLLVVLQGMDTSGKDGAVRHVFSGVNPQGVRVYSFAAPTRLELQRDFLWRIHMRMPRRGDIVVFNRSHYEDVLVARVRQLVPESVWTQRFDLINDFERLLASNGVTILKCFLHISRTEQLERLKARLADPKKNWKLTQADVDERKRWSAYTRAYEDALTRCNTDQAPWRIIPADRKWYRNWALSTLVRAELERMDPKTPPPLEDPSSIRLE